MKRAWLGLCLISCSIACNQPAEEAAKGKLQIAFRPTGLPAEAQLKDAVQFPDGGHLVDPSADDFRNISVASGPPEALTIYLKSVSLKSSQGITHTIFHDGGGRAIRMGRKTIDASAVFDSYACINAEGLAVDGIEDCSCGLDQENKAIGKNADGTCQDAGLGAVGEAETEAGDFASLIIEFFAVAKVKGCVTGNFTDMGPHTYCTKASAHTFQSSPGVDDPAELEGTPDSAALMVYQLHTASSESFSLSFPIAGGFTIEADQDAAPRLTLMIDTNRLLRFYNKNKTTEEHDRAFFFGGVFEESIFALHGEPGEVRGFHWWTDADPTIVAGWMTVIKDHDQKPVAVGLMPDDDSAATIIRGSNKTSNGLEAAAFAPHADQYDIGFAWGQTAGALQGVNLDADLLSTQSTNFLSLQNHAGRIYLKRAF